MKKIEKMDWYWREKAVACEMIFEKWREAGKITYEEQIEYQQAQNEYIVAYLNYEFVVKKLRHRLLLKIKRWFCGLRGHNDTEESSCTKCGYPWRDF